MAIPGSNIRTLRRQMGLSLEALAEAAQMNFANLSRLENGKGGYSDASIKRIADVLRVSLDVLFAPPEKVEGAALLMREAPVLNAEQLGEWRGPDSFEYPRQQRFLHVEPGRASRFSFGWTVTDEKNAPVLRPGDELVFDPNRQPMEGKYVLAQNGGGQIYLGRLRPLAEAEGKVQFEVIPLDNIDPGASTINDPSLVLKGTLVELRRSF